MKIAVLIALVLVLSFAAVASAIKAIRGEELGDARKRAEPPENGSTTALRAPAPAFDTAHGGTGLA
jgi:hypothetical protein